MKRSKFLASLAAIAVAPFVRMDSPKELPPPMPDFKQIAMSPEEVLEIYNETGVLIFQGKSYLYVKGIEDTEYRFNMTMETQLLMGRYGTV